MPTPKISRSLAEHSVAVYEQCLREGYHPSDIKAGTKGAALAEAARRLYASGQLSSLNSMNSRLRACERVGVKPDHSVFQVEKPRYRVKAGSTAPLPTPEPTPQEADRADLELRSLRATIETLRLENKALRKAEVESHVIRESIFGLAGEAPTPPEWLIETHAAHDGPGVPLTLWSDWHWGEVVRPEEAGGVNEFNIAIAHDRAKMLVERIIRLSFDHTVNPIYPGIVIMLGGDMISGEIHDELTETNELRTAPALIDLQGVLITAISALADRFGRVFLPCVVGNHGRMTHKPRAKGRVHTSFEWLLYCQLERYFAADERIRFFVPGEADAHYRVAGHRIMLTHGDSLGTRGGDGIIGCLGPILRGVIKTRYSEAQIGRDFDYCFMGHWHQYMALHEVGVFVNGALKGYDEYARLYLRARYQRPIQTLLFMHPTMGVTSVKPIYLAPHRTAVPGDAWVSWARAA